MALAVPLFLGACASQSSAPSAAVTAADQWRAQLAFEFSRIPDTIPTRWAGLIGEYGQDTTRRWYVLERDARLHVLDHTGNYIPLAERNDSTFDAPRSTAAVAGEVRFSIGGDGRATALRNGNVTAPRRVVEPPPGTTQLRVTPLRPIEDIRREALAATPPAESGSFRTPDLVELVKLDTSIRLDIRYATENNFLGTKIYDEPRAFLQRPAAEAMLRANRVIRRLGFRLLVHDAYRPWYVTKIFWDATPDSVKWLVANPAQGSKHNRGAALDVTLYDVEAKRVVEMPSTYDETTRRARADYPGGTSSQRWHRALLKRALEHEGFTVNPQEWWHFDYKDWKTFPILNVPFDKITPPAPVAPAAGRTPPR